MCHCVCLLSRVTVSVGCHVSLCLSVAVEKAEITEQEEKSETQSISDRCVIGFITDRCVIESITDSWVVRRFR